jgi:asparagine synthase (glutamine-hydrolysing)
LEFYAPANRVQVFLPCELISQPKRGFEVKLKKWVEEDLKVTIYDALSPQCYSENFLQREFIYALLRKKISISDEKRAKILWNLFCLEVWRRNI